MTTVYFIRHAEPDFEVHDDLLRPLTVKGHADAKLVTAYLKDKEIDEVLSSPYLRAIDTVKDFADESGLNIKVIYEFRERKVDSAWIEDFTSFSKKQWEDFDYKLADGESLREVQERNIKALNDVLLLHKGKNIVIGTHGTALSTIINYYQNTYGYEDFEKMKRLMPWIVKMQFNIDVCEKISKINITE
ncbi:histidine phosphatase family protein [Anaerocolumna sedimenticola]|uniref:Histidine phosphatase family protein n=1 Tax=Anaerocolumna sedimenticola TaxID=2696063 RepID=A0A6P1TUZ5_9FIRM|nr:histidine phosphatase family protein [Anaerocolumna sedimenticola]QHQ63255.1 histidine phosphatase family protein [Anaerocolumna sedimenticola]